jgi:asparagine synthase (glutamine-hydrolysing)
MFFSSEIKPILELRKTSLNPQATIDYFAYRYNIQNGLTLFDGIERFFPACYWQIDLKTSRIVKKSYWRLEFREFDYGYEEIQGKFNDLLDSEIASQSVADVPVGIYLSGGIDSRALLHGFSKTVESIHSFTITFSSDDEDLKRVNALESKVAFHKNTFSFTPDCFQDIEDVVFSLEEPFGDLIISPNYFLPQHASKKVKVVLSGEGGDEAFLGYDHQRAFLKMTTIGKTEVTRFLFRLLLKICPTWLVAMANTYPGGFGADEHSRIEEVVGHMSSPVEAYIRLVSLFSDSEIRAIFAPSFLNHSPRQPDRKYLKRIFSDSEYVWQAVMRSEIELLTLIVNLLKQDRFGMRFSLEGRVPFVSRRILDFVATLPLDKLVGRINKKYLLHYSSSRPLQKRPFSVFASPAYRGVILNLMSKYMDEKSVDECGVVSQECVSRLQLGVKKGQMLAAKKAMAVLVFMIWWKKFRVYLRG